MNKRLAWNFEITNENPLDLSVLAIGEPSSRWEARYFWEEDAIITLQGLNTDFLNLAHYKVKERHDHYYLLPHHPYNIKERRGELLYKPLIETTPSGQAFGKKINLTTESRAATLPGLFPITVNNLLHLIETESVNVAVEKTALIYKFPLQPTIKLELARLSVAEKIYFSVCVEGASAQLVTLISQHLLNQADSCDYVQFLKKIYGAVS